eukprot:TRINITY_DN5995_c0_g1_i2.p1 TRINITY_DN5995_c0_g1~~TRINITY_DN5995_c0_g1_i2.p1  ORF type:complete len:526 (+),score=103.89 TRINITY_DN5995_c0_g1_i2:71-1579(+)
MAFTVLLVGSGPQNRSMPMFLKLHSLGVKIVLVDEPESWTAELEVLCLIHKRVVLPGLSSLPQDAHLAQEILRAVQQESLGPIHGVYNAYNKYLLITSLVAQALHVAGNSFEAVERCVFKHLTRECLMSSGLESWSTFSIITMDEMKEAAHAMTYPAVLKPAKGSGSTGVVRVESADEAMHEFAKLQQRSWVREDTVFILEEYIEGPEFGVELVMQGGVVRFSSIMDAAKQASGSYFQGTGRSCPSVEPADVQAHVLQHCAAAAQVVGLTSGVIDMDVRWSAKFGPRVIEINPRMGGGSVHIMHEIAYNIDLVEVQLRTALDLPVRDLFTARPSDIHFEAGWVMSPHSGQVQNIEAFADGLKAQFQLCVDLVRIEALAQNGTHAIGYNVNGLPTSLIQVVTKGNSKSAALQTLGIILLSADARIEELVPPDPEVVESCVLMPSAVSPSIFEAAVQSLSILEVAAQVAHLSGTMEAILSPKNASHALIQPSFQIFSESALSQA